MHFVRQYFCHVIVHTHHHTPYTATDCAHCLNQICNIYTFIIFILFFHLSKLSYLSYHLCFLQDYFSSNIDIAWCGIGVHKEMVTGLCQIEESISINSNHVIRLQAENYQLHSLTIWNTSSIACEKSPYSFTPLLHTSQFRPLHFSPYSGAL